MYTDISNNRKYLPFSEKLSMYTYMSNIYHFQKTLGEEGSSLEFRHITSYSMWYCGHHTCEELLHEVIVCVGYFTVLAPDNQVYYVVTSLHHLQIMITLPSLHNTSKVLLHEVVVCVRYFAVLASDNRVY